MHLLFFVSFYVLRIFVVGFVRVGARLLAFCREHFLRKGYFLVFAETTFLGDRVFTPV